MAFIVRNILTSKIGRLFLPAADETQFTSMPIIAVLVASGMILSFYASFLSDSLRTLDFAASLFVTAAVAALLEMWSPRSSRWFIILASVAIALLLHIWLTVPGSLALLAIAVGLTAIMVSVVAGSLAAILMTALLLLAPLPLSVNRGDVLSAIIAIWSTLSLILIVYRYAHQRIVWSSEQYEHARALLERARDRQVELDQALADLTHASRQLALMNAKLAAATQAAEDAQKAKAEFVANISHELRTPLNMIIGFAEMIMQSPETYGASIPQALLADLAVILRNSQHLSSLIDDVLDLSQVEAGQMALVCERVSLQEVISAAMLAVQPLFKAKNLYITMQEGKDVPAIFCDRVRIRQVVLNLLSNAGRFTDSGGVDIRLWREGSKAVVSITDTGPGITQEDIKRLFQPFQQLDGSLKRRHKGSGLGLSISRSLVELHGGRMWVESEKGRGTTFFFSLPIDPPAPPDPGARRWFNPYTPYEKRPHRSRSLITGVQPHLIIVEQGTVLQRLLSRYLSGIELITVKTVHEAAQLLPHVPTAALLINDVSVSQTLESIAQSNVIPPTVPTIICSVPDISEVADELGATTYLVKPIGKEKLLSALNNIGIKGKTILIVDDDPDSLRLFRRMLLSAKRGYRVLRATDGMEALAIMREQHPSAVLLDLALPGMDGFQVLAEKNRDSLCRDIPLLIISARDPWRQPIVSSAMAVTQTGGLSVQQLLACIAALSAKTAPGMRTVDQVPPTMSPA